MTALRACIVIGVAALWMVLVVPPLFESPPSAYTGVKLVMSGAAFQPNLASVAAGSPAYRAGLRSGDVLGCLSLRDYSLLFNPSLGFGAAYSRDATISTCVQRDGRTRTIRFAPEPGPAIQSWYGSTALALLRVCVLLVFLLTGIALVLVKPSPMTWIFFAYCLSTAPSIGATMVGTAYPPQIYPFTVATLQYVTTTTVGFLLVFTALVPDTRLPRGWRRSALSISIALAAVDAAVVAAATFFTGFTVSWSMEFRTDQTMTALTVLLVIVRLWTMKREERARFGWAAFAIIFGVITNDLRNFLIGHEPVINTIGISAAYLTVVMPICLVYGILRRHVIDVRFVISRTVVYAALTTLIVAVIGLVDWLTSAYLSQVRVAMAIEAAVTIALAFALHRAYAAIESAVDFLLFRHKHNAETYLHRMGKTLTRAKREETIDRALVSAPYEKFDLTMAALFRPVDGSYATTFTAGLAQAYSFDGESELVRFLLTERGNLHLHDLHGHAAEAFDSEGPTPAVAVPLFQGDDLLAFALYGIHRDGTKLDPDEIECLERLCETGAQAYTAIELARYRELSGSAPPLERLQLQ